MAKGQPAKPVPASQPSPLVDTRVIYCGDNLDQLRKLSDAFTNTRCRRKGEGQVS